MKINLLKRSKLAMTVFAASVTLLSLATPGAASAHTAWQKTQINKPNIVETAVSVNQSTGEFSTLIAAASCTNIAKRLSNEHREYTLFAPTDAAFAKLSLNKDNICSSFSRSELTKILRFHITWGTLDAAEVVSKDSLCMLNGHDAKIAGATINGQNIIKTDIFASNGVIHVIDGVLLP